MWFWLLSGGERLLLEAPAFSSHRSAVVLGLLISGDDVVECCQYGIPHPVDVFGMGTHSLAVVGRQLIDGCLGQFPEAPTSEGDANLLPRCCQLAKGRAESFDDVVDALHLL